MTAGSFPSRDSFDGNLPITRRLRIWDCLAFTRLSSGHYGTYARLNISIWWGPILYCLPYLPFAVYQNVAVA